MHKFRGRAKRAAWYDNEDDGRPNFNPFRKIGSRGTNVTEDDEENAIRIRTNYSENFLTTRAEQDRATESIERYQIPKHADTMPSPSTSRAAGAPAVRDMAFEQAENDRKSAEKSQDSGAGNSETTRVEREPEAEPKLDLQETANGDIGGEPQVIAETPTTESKPRRRRIPFLHKKDGPTDGGPPRKKSSLFKKSKEGQKFTAMSQLRATIFNSYVNILLVFVPIGIAVNYAHIAPVGIFVINFIAIIPLAGMLSYATEEIALRTGETIGGLLNASFGNAVELIVSIIALAKNEVDIVQESLIGSMLSNLLLVMGMCFFFGGLTRIRQHFNQTVAQTASSLLALAVGSLIIPAAFQAWAATSNQADKESKITALSRGTAILLLIVYMCYLLFQLKTHAEIYNAPSEKVEKRTKKHDRGEARKSIANIGAGMSATMGGQASQEKPTQEPEDPAEQPRLDKWVAIFTLAASTVLVALCAEFMVDSIDAITKSGGVSRTFVGLILLPIVGNAAEHATAVTVACKDKMDLAIGVAVGSSMQIALLVIPFVVVLGWIMGKEDMNLAFDAFQITVLFVAILLVNYLIQDGESHWLEGVLLQTLYLIIAIAAWFYPPPPGTENA